MDVGLAVSPLSKLVMAVFALTFPKPKAEEYVPPPLVYIRFLSSLGVKFGFLESNKVAIPDTMGAAKEVPSA